MRLFIGIALPKNVKKELARAKRELMDNSESGRFTPEESYHITLHFIGESNQLAPAVAAMQEAVRGIRSFSLHLDRYDCFERAGGDIAYINVKGDLDELSVLHDCLETALHEQGFARENKRFSPHITLVRALKQTPEQKEQLKAMRMDASFLVNGIHLFESRRTDDGMEYVSLHCERLN